MTYLTRKEVLQKYHLSSTKFWRLKEDCLLSPYRKAVSFQSAKRYLIVQESWENFLEWRSENIYKERYGLG